MFKVLQLGLIITAVLSVASVFGRSRYLELTTHFRLQYALVATGYVLLFAVEPQSLMFFFIAVCCAALNWSYLVPYYLSAAHPPSAAQKIRFKVMLSNVLGSSTRYAWLLEAVEEQRPDVVVLQEVTDAWWNRVQVLTEEYPYYKAIPKGGGSGLALLSRFPFDQAEVLMLDASAHPASIIAKINIDETVISLLTLHPPTPMRRSMFAHRNGQFAKAKQIIRATQGAKMLIGDLNVSPWSPYFRDLLSGSGLRDARIGSGVYPTWPLPLPSFLRIPIDHCLISDEIRVGKINTRCRVGSDHCPLVVELQVEK